MQSTATTEEDQKKDDKGIVRSVRFFPDQWARVLAKTTELDVPVGTFIRNATLAAVGGPTEADRYRELAAQLDGGASEPKAPKAKPPVKVAPKAPVKKSAKQAKAAARAR